MFRVEERGELSVQGSGSWGEENCPRTGLEAKCITTHSERVTCGGCHVQSCYSVQFSLCGRGRVDSRPR